MGKIDKQKVITAAQKYQQKGNFKKAIKEYQKFLKEDPSDIRTRLKIADLYTRMGNKGDAVQTFKDVADFYQQQGFIFKAVAVYKQIIKLCPDDVDVHIHLSTLYQQLGLIADAISQLRVAIGIYEKKGDETQKLLLIKKMLDLDPENVEARVKLAENFSSVGMVPEAVSLFRESCKILKEKGAKEDFIKVAERLLYHQPDDFDICKDLALYYIEKKDGLHALSRLQICYKLNNKEPEILELLGQTFEFLAQPHKAVSVYKALSKIYERSGLINERNEVYKKILQINPDEQSAKEALHLTKLEDEYMDLEFEPISDIKKIEMEENQEYEEIPIDEVGEDTDVSPFENIADEELEEVKISTDTTLEAKIEEMDPELRNSIEELDFYLSHKFIDEAKALLDELQKKYHDNQILKEKVQSLSRMEGSEGNCIIKNLHEI